jgi:hypothetical protein
MEKIQVNEKDLYVLLISEMRYAMDRDNHLAPFTFMSFFKKYIKSFTNESKKRLIEQVINEIEYNLKLKNYNYKDYWKDFIIELESFTK